MFRIAHSTSRFLLLRPPGLQYIKTHRTLASVAAAKHKPRQEDQQKPRVEHSVPRDISTKVARGHGDQIHVEGGAAKRKSRFAVSADEQDEIVKYLSRGFATQRKNQKVADDKRVSIVGKELCRTY